LDDGDNNNIKTFHSPTLKLEVNVQVLLSLAFSILTFSFPIFLDNDLIQLVDTFALRSKSPSHIQGDDTGESQQRRSVSEPSKRAEASERKASVDQSILLFLFLLPTNHHQPL